MNCQRSWSTLFTDFVVCYKPSKGIDELQHKHIHAIQCHGQLLWRLVRNANYLLRSHGTDESSEGLFQYHKNDVKLSNSDSAEQQRILFAEIVKCSNSPLLAAVIRSHMMYVWHLEAPASDLPDFLSAAHSITFPWFIAFASLGWWLWWFKVNLQSYRTGHIEWDSPNRNGWLMSSSSPSTIRPQPAAEHASSIIRQLSQGKVMSFERTKKKRADHFNLFAVPYTVAPHGWIVSSGPRIEMRMQRLAPEVYLPWNGKNGHVQGPGPGSSWLVYIKVSATNLQLRCSLSRCT